MEQHLALCRQYEIETDELEQREEPLLHALTGAAVAREIFGASPEIESAIRYHTTGKADMTTLEKIIYLADMIEPNRKPYPGLEPLRELCMRDLDQAMHTALRMSYEHVMEQGKTLHPDTLAALKTYEPEQTV